MGRHGAACSPCSMSTCAFERAVSTRKRYTGMVRMQCRALSLASSSMENPFTHIRLRLARLLPVVLSVALTAQAVHAQALPPSSSSRTSILPAPTGSYGVGVVAHGVTDPRRREIFTADTSDIRRFPVRVYYPAAKASCAPGAYFPPNLAEV